MSVTFLSCEQIEGPQALEVLQKYGCATSATDLNLILGVMVHPQYHDIEGNKACAYWTRDSRLYEVIFIRENSIWYQPPTARRASSRPIMPVKDTRKIKPDKIKDLRLRNGETVQICEYGEYPQTVVDNDMANKLENTFKINGLKTTGKSYTFDTAGLFNNNQPFAPYKCPEYIMDGQKYIRILGKPYDEDSVLSDGREVKEGESYWVKVQPIEWLKDKSGVWVAKKALFSGIQFDTKREYDGNFADTFMAKSYLPIFEKEMQPSSAQERTQTISNTQSEPSKRQKKYGITVEQAPMPVSEQLQFYFNNGMSCMLHGPSGIGKTARVEEIDADLTAVPLWNGVLPEDIVGKVIYPDGTKDLATEENISKGTWVAPDWYNELTKKCQAEPDKKHVLFIDEVTNARPTTQSLIFHMVLKKSISPSKGKLPDNCVVMLAGNSKEESGAAYNMPEPLFRRMCGHIYLKPDIGEWLIWGSEPSRKHPEDKERKNIHPLVAGFVATYGQDTFYTAYDEENPKEWAMDPRGWEQVSDLIYDNKGIIRRELLISKMGEEIASSFIEYANNPPLSKEEILAQEYSQVDIPTGSDAKLALALSLRDANEKEVGPIRKFISDNLGQENLAVFDSLWVGKNDERAVQIAQMQSFINKGR